MLTGKVSPRTGPRPGAPPARTVTGKLRTRTLRGSHHDLPVRMSYSPLVPRAAENFSLARHAVLARLRGLDQAGELTFTQVAALVRAAVGQREEFAGQIEQHDGAAVQPRPACARPARSRRRRRTTCLAMSRFHDFSPKLAREMSGTGMPPSIALQRGVLGLRLRLRHFQHFEDIVAAG